MSINQYTYSKNKFKKKIANFFGKYFYKRETLYVFIDI